MSYKNWIFVLNNYTVDTESMMQVSHSEVTYIVYGHEVGESGTPHLQGYLELDKKRTLNSVKKLFGVNSLHLEPRAGTQKQAVDYAIKDGNDIYERGTPAPSVGRPPVIKNQNKILVYKDQIKQGLGTFADHPDASFHLLKHAQMYVSLTESPRKTSTKPHVTWLWGPTGTGKTLRAWKAAENMGLEPYLKSGNGKWFDGYDAHRFVIFDDFRDSHVEFGFLLRLLDRYPLRVELKGSSRQWKADTIFITSPLPPHECYATMQATDKYDRIDQLLRRIDVIEHVTTLDASLIEAPQPPKGGVKRDNEPTDDYSPATYKYLLPVRRFSGLPPLPRSPLVLGDCQSPGPTHPSQTQEWAPPPGCD